MHAEASNQGHSYIEGVDNVHGGAPCSKVQLTTLDAVLHAAGETEGLFLLKIDAQGHVCHGHPCHPYHPCMP